MCTPRVVVRVELAASTAGVPMPLVRGCACAALDAGFAEPKGRCASKQDEARVQGDARMLLL
jgi:hypothetical protein